MHTDLTDTVSNPKYYYAKETSEMHCAGTYTGAATSAAAACSAAIMYATIIIAAAAAATSQVWLCCHLPHMSLDVAARMLLAFDPW